jgi:hypothetical protein
VEPLNSVRKLAWLAGTTPKRLREICNEIDRDKTSHYQFWSEPDKHKPHVFRQFRDVGHGLQLESASSQLHARTCHRVTFTLLLFHEYAGRRIHSPGWHQPLQDLVR